MSVQTIHQTLQSKILLRNDVYRSSNRNIKLDILKGIAIFCVVWGHFIQQGTLNGVNCLDNPVEQLIYSFHMPLFMMISGYLMYKSIHKRSLFQQWKHWAESLLLPLIVWTIIANICVVIYKIITIGTLDGYLWNYNQYWFIISLLVCGIVTTLIKSICKDKLIVYIVFGALLLLTTINVFNIGWMFPFFMGGYLLNKYSRVVKPIFQKFAFISLLLFPLLVIFYNASSFSYASIVGISDLFNGSLLQIPMEEYLASVTHNLYKIITSLAGCGFLYCIVEKLTQINVPSITSILSWLGAESLTIYFIQRILIEIFFGRYLYSSYLVVYDFILTLLISIISVIIFAFFATLLQKNKYINLILRGGEEMTPSSLGKLPLMFNHEGHNQTLPLRIPSLRVQQGCA